MDNADEDALRVTVTLSTPSSEEPSCIMVSNRNTQ